MEEVAYVRYFLKEDQKWSWNKLLRPFTKKISTERKTEMWSSLATMEILKILLFQGGWILWSGCFFPQSITC